MGCATDVRLLLASPEPEEAETAPAGARWVAFPRPVCRRIRLPASDPLRHPHTRALRDLARQTLEVAVGREDRLAVCPDGPVSRP